MKANPTYRRATHAALFLVGGILGLLPLHAQSTGTIQGRVYNPATSQYVRNAEVRLLGNKTREQAAKHEASNTL